MAVMPTLPVALSAVGTLALGAVQRLSQGLPFADVLRGGGRSNSSAAPSDAANAIATQSPELALAHPNRLADLEKVRRETEAALQRFGQSARQRLGKAGIDLSLPIDLQSDGHGGVLASGDHPQRAFIEQLFGDNPDLARAFHELLQRLYSMRPLDPTENGQPTDAWDATRISLVLKGEEATVQFNDPAAAI
jgi:hypothetical protein